MKINAIPNHLLKAIFLNVVIVILSSPLTKCSKMKSTHFCHGIQLIYDIMFEHISQHHVANMVDEISIFSTGYLHIFCINLYLYNKYAFRTGI